MRIAFTLGGTDWGRSGIGRYVREVFPRLNALVTADGGEILVIGNPKEMDAYKDVLGRARRIMTPSAANAPALSAGWYLGLSGIFAKRTGADVLLLPAANRRIVLYSPIPTVAVVHDLAQLKVADKYDRARMLYFQRVLVPTLRRMTTLVAVSAATRNDICKAIDIPTTVVRVVPNGVNTERFFPMSPDDPHIFEAKKQCGIEGRYILYPSRLEHPGKNHIRLVRAFANSRARQTHTLAFAGGDWGAKQLIEAEIAAHKLEDRVRLLGYVSEANLPGLVAGADMVVMMGLHEGFGLPALEALATGRRVCVSNTGALPEVVGSLGVLCNPLSERSIAEAIDSAIENEELRLRCSEEGPAWAAAHDWDRTARGLYTACKGALHR